ncbi:MAG: hypothetical protein EBU01_06665 [Crocinitomicaceae bacterium]|nr:hypothetical protein [Crocinitomicaceae bacterium]
MSVAVLPQVNLPQGVLQKRVGVKPQEVRPEEPKLELLDENQALIVAVLSLIPDSPIEYVLEDEKKVGGVKRLRDEDPRPPQKDLTKEEIDEALEEVVRKCAKPGAIEKAKGKTSGIAAKRLKIQKKKPTQIRVPKKLARPPTGALVNLDEILKKPGSPLGQQTAAAEARKIQEIHEELEQRRTTKLREMILQGIHNIVTIPGALREFATRHRENLQMVIAALGPVALYDLGSKNSLITLYLTTLIKTILPFIPTPYESLMSVIYTGSNLAGLLSALFPLALPVGAMLAAGYVAKLMVNGTLSGLRTISTPEGIRYIFQGLALTAVELREFARNPRATFARLGDAAYRGFMNYIDPDGQLGRRLTAPTEVAAAGAVAAAALAEVPVPPAEVEHIRQQVEERLAPAAAAAAEELTAEELEALEALRLLMNPQGGKRRTRRHRKNNLRRRTQKR